ncbi:hypothetical protein GCM10023091_23600 [Ravibacter arvi]|uniref:AAA domain-containing protein n=1 Tax=Ravibacter arvi TaxID=2051041 RepID=A0ABP8M0I5_9BACT
MNIEFNRHGISVQDIQAEANRQASEEEKSDRLSDGLKAILTTSEKLRELKENEIEFSEPVLMQGDNPVIFPHTINVIQGQAGVHKSRLAETICAAFLKQNGCNNELLGFKRLNSNVTHTVVYVDTERNLSEQLPYALQSIQIQAGYKRGDHPDNFEYISLLQVKRTDRFRMLQEYLSHIRSITNSPLFVVLDVSTDCIEDFNEIGKSMELIDLMNMAINEHNVIFMCLIHENPRSDKARGHFGTELMNKASTVIQVGFEKDAHHNDSDLIRVKYLKCRSTARHAPFHIRYSNDANGLVLADTCEVSKVANKRRQKAGNADIVEHIEMYLGDGSVLTRTDLLDRLCKDFNASQRTIESRLSEIIKFDTIIHDETGFQCKLTKSVKNKEVYYKLTQHISL